MPATVPVDRVAGGLVALPAMEAVVVKLVWLSLRAVVVDAEPVVVVVVVPVREVVAAFVVLGCPGEVVVDARVVVPTAVEEGGMVLKGANVAVVPLGLNVLFPVAEEETTTIEDSVPCGDGEAVLPMTAVDIPAAVLVGAGGGCVTA